MKIYEILIDDIGTEQYIEAANEKKALKMAKDMEKLNLCNNHMGNAHGIVTVDEQTPKDLIKRIKEIRECQKAERARAAEALKSKDQEISLLKTAITGRDLDKKLLKEQLIQARNRFEERHNAVIRRQEQIDALEIENNELRDKLNELQKVEDAIRILKGIL